MRRKGERIYKNAGKIPRREKRKIKKKGDEKEEGTYLTKTLGCRRKANKTK